MKAAAALALLLLLATAGDAHAQEAAKRLDRDLLLVRVFLAVAAFGVLVWTRRLAKSGRAQRWARSRRAVLGALAALSFLTNYNFFVSTGIHKKEFFHYYLGARYSPELGYFEIYRCTIAAAFEQRFEESDPLFWVTDLRNEDVRMFWVLAPRRPRCDGAFSPERWEAFKADISRFRDILGPEWRRVLRDHGFNPSPIWTLIARPLTALFPFESGSLWILARLDLVLILVLLAAIGWAFGFEAACLAAIAWGVNPNTRYAWIGDAFLRNLWLASSMIGLCLLRKGLPVGAGALLTLSSLLRLFPSLFVFGYGLHALRGWLRGESPGPGFRRFVTSSLITGLVLAGLAAVATGRGPASFLEFSRRITTLNTFVPNNGFGLRHLLSYTTKRPAPEVVDGVPTERMKSVQKLRNEALAGRRILQLGVIAVFLGLFWRALPKARDWEAAAMGAALIPVLTMPAAYYLSFALAGVLLATRRPRIAIELMVALIAWNVAALAMPSLPRGLPIGSAIGLLFFLGLLLEMQRSPDARDAA